MFSLTTKSLDHALSALASHGFGDFFPDPPEFDLVRGNWSSIRAELSSTDLDTFGGYQRVASFAPKSRLNVRRVTLLHPYDLLLFTALILDLRDGISSARLSASENRVFSHRADNSADGVLYEATPSYPQFKLAIEGRVRVSPTVYLGITDIADFYPRVYQHRLVNALQAACGPAKHDHIRVLEKMLYRFADGASYGIPIGPAASRVLGEAVLIDVDSTLLSNGVDFVRFTDDYVIFSPDPEGAEYGIGFLVKRFF
jgi:hypothetical protein